MKKHLFILSLIFSQITLAQVGIGTSAPNTSAMLDVTSTDKGLLAPRISLIGTLDTSTIATPATGLLIYNTSTAGSGATAISPGFYFYTGSKWERLLNTDSITSIPFSGTISATAFVGDGSGLTNIGTSSSTFKDAYSNVVVGSKLVSLIPSITIREGYNDDFFGYRNLAIGDSTLVSNTEGSKNVALGHSALYSNTDGNNNIAIGNSALADNDDGDNNIAIGENALQNNDDGHDNIAIGEYALADNEDGDDNIAIGEYALGTNEYGGNNIALGNDALYELEDGENNIGIGSSALGSSQHGNNNIAIGEGALYSANGSLSTIISNNTVIGQDALAEIGKINETVGLGTSLGKNLDSNDTLFGVTLIGSSATTVSGVVSNSTALGYRATVTLSNTIQLGNSDVNLVNTSATVSATAFVGDGSGLTNIGTSSSTFKDAYSNVTLGTSMPNLTTGYYNTALGANSLNSNTEGSANVAIGEDALQYNTKGSENIAIGEDALKNNTEGDKNIAIGDDSMESNTTGDYNTAVGDNSLNNNTTGNYNVALGKSALYSNTLGNWNVAVGSSALEANDGGTENTAIGNKAMEDNISGIKNIAVGEEALTNNEDGNENSALGSDALYNNTSGDFNVAIGRESLEGNTTGSNNAGLGIQSGITITTGSGNTFLGAYSDASTGTLSNSTAIGYGASVTASNTIQLGNTSIVEISGNVAFSPASDRRLKENIKGTKYGLDEVLKLEPVDYVLKSNGLKQVGFIAQDVKPLIPEVVTGIEGDLEKGETLGIAYSSLIPVLTKAIQEQQKTIEALKENQEKLAAQIALLLEKLN